MLVYKSSKVKQLIPEKQGEVNSTQKEDDSKMKNSMNSAKKLRDIYGFCNSVEYILSKNH
jgi:hypothetical protein